MHTPGDEYPASPSWVPHSWRRRGCRLDHVAIALLVLALSGCGQGSIPGVTPHMPARGTPPIEAHASATAVPRPAATSLPTATPELPGKVAVGGHQLYLSCQGQGRPAVVLEAGMGIAGVKSETWLPVQVPVSQFTRVCSYDRAGLGESERGPQPRTCQGMVEELHALLEAAAIDGPYVLAGHSFGGMLVRLYAHQYPSEVVGLSR